MEDKTFFDIISDGNESEVNVENSGDSIDKGSKKKKEKKPKKSDSDNVNNTSKEEAAEKKAKAKKEAAEKKAKAKEEAAEKKAKAKEEAAEKKAKAKEEAAKKKAKAKEEAAEKKAKATTEGAEDKAKVKAEAAEKKAKAKAEAAEKKAKAKAEAAEKKAKAKAEAAENKAKTKKSDISEFTDVDNFGADNDFVILENSIEEVSESTDVIGSEEVTEDIVGIEEITEIIGENEEFSAAEEIGETLIESDGKKAKKEKTKKEKVKKEKPEKKKPETKEEALQMKAEKKAAKAEAKELKEAKLREKIIERYEADKLIAEYKVEEKKKKLKAKKEKLKAKAEKKKQQLLEKEGMLPDDFDEELGGFSDLMTANKTAIISFTVLVSIILLAYVAEFAKGSRTFTYVGIACAIGVVTMISGWVLYLKNKDSFWMKHVIAWGYGVLYAYLLLTANNAMVFTYVIPLMIVVTLFNKNAYTLSVGIGALVINAIDIVRQFVTVKNMPPEQIVNIEIQGLLTVLTVAFFLAVALTTAKLNRVKLRRINEEKSKVSNILQDILKVAEDLTDNVDVVSGQMVVLEGSVDKTIGSMSEVSQGTNETAEAIQNQLVKTEDIQSQIGKVEESSKLISRNMKITSNVIYEGKKNVRKLMTITNVAEKTGNNVANTLEVFKEYTSQMNSITELITSVASQTSLLALNASIEAARAGESGKGFSVVASEISNLADQTTVATNNITDLIENISNELNVMVSDISELLDANKEQAKSAEKTVRNFEKIAEKIKLVDSQSAGMNEAVTHLVAANKEIIDSIQTISAITEQVSAHSSETYSISEDNRDIVNKTYEVVQRLNEEASVLKKYEI